MSLTLVRALNPQERRPDRLTLEEQEPQFNITVVATDTNSTIAALNRAGALAESLGARITMVVPQTVPYRLPLASPPVHLEFQERRFLEIASRSPVDIQVQLYLCRDAFETLCKILSPHSLIVMGGRKRFWRTREQSLAHKLLNKGHDVIFAEAE